MLGVYFFRLPVVASDTDLWYHLNGGRYLFDTGVIPHTGFFSFLTPEKQWVDYYWLFQAVIYKIYSLAGYAGIIVFRAVLYLATISLVFQYLYKNRVEKWLPVFFVLFCLLLLYRNSIVRPHIFSYLFIVSFLVILEFYPKKVKYLPILAILWANLHGIEYPVLMLIIFSYVVDHYLKRLRATSAVSKNEIYYLVSLVASMAAVFITPHGIKLIRVPFISTEYASAYMKELGKISIDQVLYFNFSSPSSIHSSIFNILLISICLAVIINLFKKSIKVKHILLFLGGVVLLAKGNRFTVEFILLSLPCIKLEKKLTLHPAGRTGSILLFILTAFFLFFVPFKLLDFKGLPKYPFSNSNLPHGVTSFLNHIDKKGTVMNFPVNGGYLQWMLYPDYKIAMDMEVPFLFSDDDYFKVRHSFLNEVCLRKFISTYNPAFIAAPWKPAAFKKFFNTHIRQFPEYVPVFFDEIEALYVNKQKLPEIADKYQLKKIDPFMLVSSGISRISDDDKDPVFNELLKMWDISPDSRIVNWAIASVYNTSGNYDKSALYIEVLVKEFPERPEGYNLSGDSFSGRKMFKEAISSYQEALARMDEAGKNEIYKKLWTCHTHLLQHKEAYSILKKVVNPFSPASNYVDLYKLGFSALQIGKTIEARNLMKFAYMQVPDNDITWKSRIKEQLLKLNVD